MKSPRGLGNVGVNESKLNDLETSNPAALAAFQLAQVPSVHVPSNVFVTDLVLALQVNKMADIAVIHGGIGTAMTAAQAGKPVVGTGMLGPSWDQNPWFYGPIQ